MGSVACLAIDDDGWCFASGSKDSTIKFWDASCLAEVCMPPACAWARAFQIPDSVYSFDKSDQACLSVRGMPDTTVEAIVEKCSSIRVRHFSAWHRIDSIFPSAMRTGGDPYSLPFAQAQCLSLHVPAPRPRH